MLRSYNKLQLFTPFELWRQTIALGFGIVALATSALAESSSDILSKSDAARMFATSLTEWNENVTGAKMYGAAEAIKGSGSALMMVSLDPVTLWPLRKRTGEPALGFLMVHPIYEVVKWLLIFH
jgi:hypothetical protein